MRPIFFHQDTTKTKVQFDTTKKGYEVAHALQALRHTIESPLPLSRTVLERYHTKQYIDAIEFGEPHDLAESQGFAWDENTWLSATAQTGAMVAAVYAAMAQGSAYALASGFHHAAAGHGGGFCTFNGIAIAAGEALAAGARRVIVLDFDAHGGGGTHGMISGWENILHYDLSTSPYEYYTPTAPHRRAHVSNALQYLPTIQALLEDLDTQVLPRDVVILNAGMDSYEGCDIGGLNGITIEMLRERDRLVDIWARRNQLSVAACLAGGYQGNRYPQELLVQIHTESVLRICAD